jgi:hypothetical protein
MGLSSAPRAEPARRAGPKLAHPLCCFGNPRGDNRLFGGVVVATTGGAVCAASSGSSGIRFLLANDSGDCNYGNGKKLRQSDGKN